MKDVDPTGELVARLVSLEAEARALRAQVARAEAAGRVAGSGWLAVRVGDTLACLGLDVVDEVVPVARLSPLPDAPPWVAGLLDRAGELLPVVDVLARVERRAREVALSDRIVLAHAGDRRLGLLVQDVLGLREAGADALQEAPAHVPHAPYVTGVVPLDLGHAALLSPALLLYTSDVPAGGETPR